MKKHGAVILLCCLACSVFASAKTIEIHNTKLKLQFTQTDSEVYITKIESKKDGFNFLPRLSKTALWEVDFYKRGAKLKTNYRGGSAGLPVDLTGDNGDIVGIDSLSSDALVTCSVLKENYLELVWDKIKLPDGAVVKVKVTIELPADKPISLWRISVTADSAKYSLWQIRFVKISGLAREMKQENEYFLLSAGIGQRNPMPASGAIEWYYPSSCMGIQMSSYILSARKKGFFMACYDGDANIKKFHLGNENGDVNHFWEHYPENMGRISGEYTVPYPVVIGAYDGDWFEASQFYKDWAVKQSWCSRGKMATNDISKWFKDVNLWKRPDGDPAKMQKNMLEFREWFGQPFAVQWYTWNEVTYDSLYPDFFPSRPGFAKAVAAMEAKGIRIFPYINGLLCDPKCDTWKEGAEKWVAKTFEGKLYPYPVESSFWSYHMCPATKFWQDKILSVCKRLESEAATSGIYFDCVGGMDPKLCFDESHGHPLGGGHYYADGFQSMMKNIREYFRNQNRNIAFTTELMSEPLIGSFDGALMCTIDSDRLIPLFNSIYSQYIITFGRGERWEDWEQAGCFENREAEVFTFGMQAGWQVGGKNSSENFELAPEYIKRSEFFKELANARIAGSKYLVYGDMMKSLEFNEKIPTVKLGGTYKVFFGKAFDKPVVYSSTWKDAKGTIGLVLVNSSKSDVKVSYAINPGDYGLDSSKSVKARQLYPAAEAIGTTYKPGAMLCSEVLKSTSVLIVELSQ